MRKRLAIVGWSEEGLSLIPLLEANPDVEICALVTTDPTETRQALDQLDPALGDRFAERLTSNGHAVLSTPGLVALIDANPPESLRSVLDEASGYSIQVTTPLIAKLLYAFGPVDASRKPDLLQTLSEILESYNLTIDRGGLLSRILQIAVGATGADRGSLMLYDVERDELAVEVAIGIEREVIPKIRVRPGEGVAGKAFSERRAMLLHGKADRQKYSVVREREDVESSICAPLIHGETVLGVLNLSHGLRRGAFTEEDLEFVTQLARIDAKIILRAEEYHDLLRDSARLRAQSEVHKLLTRGGPLQERLSEVCRFVARELGGGICHLYLRPTERDVLVLRASSTAIDQLAAPLRIQFDEGVHGRAARTREPVILTERYGGGQACFGILPLVAQDTVLGVMSFEGVETEPTGGMLPEKAEAIADTLSAELAGALRAAGMEREAMKMTAISEASSTLAASTDSAELHRAIASSAAMILEAEHAILRLQDPATGRFQIRAYFGSAESELQVELFTLEKQLSIEAIKRRAPSRIVDLAESGADTPQGLGVSSSLVYPLQRNGRVTGSLSVLGKVTADPMVEESFSSEDQAVLARFAEQAFQAIERVSEREFARHHRRFDSVTGLPNTTLLCERLEEEIARSSELDRTLALIRVHIPGLKNLLDSQVEAEGDRLVLSLAQELRAGLRDFDVVARTGPDAFELLVPEPEIELATLLGPIARRLRAAIRREPDPSLDERLRLEFGYALYPDEANTARALRERAQVSRISTD